MIWILMLLNMMFVASDAIRDKGVNRIADWWEWHFAKWISFFGMQGLIILLAVKAGLIPVEMKSLWIGILYAILCNITWNITYRS